MKTLKAVSLLLSLTAVSLLPVSQTAFADTPGSPASSVADQGQADQLINQVEQTLVGAKSLTANFQEIDSYPGEYRDLKQAGNVTLVRPNEINIVIKRFRRVSSSDPWSPSGNNAKSVSDGTTYTYAFLHPHSTQIQQSSAGPSAIRSALKGLPSLTGFFQTQASSKLPGQTGPASSLPDASWNGASYKVIQYQVASRQDSDPTTATAYIGSDNLIHRLVYEKQGKDGVSTREWTFDTITLNSNPPSSEFSYVPPKDATTLDNSDVSGALAPCSDAPDFTAYTSDGKAVKLSDYRGKTVILDFWATWCWPCNQSLPHTEEISKQYKDRGVIVLAVAVRDGKVGFDEWLKRHSYPDINFVRDPNPQGKDAASTLYGVTTTPTAYVIDPNGKVVQSIDGYSGPSNELASAVTFALDHKTADANLK